MDEPIKFFVGLDVHKDSMSVAACDASREPARFVGTLGPDVNKLLKVLAKAGAPAEVSVSYEAGPTGYGLYRELRRRGYHCEIVAPSLIPRRPGDRIKTDRRDCVRLAELSRSGELKSIWVPDEAHEAMRDLCRAREGAVAARMRARQQLEAFLLRHERRYPGKTSWTKSHAIWIAAQRFEHVGERVALGEYQLAVQAADERVQRLTDALGDAVKGWRFETVVAALRALRGIDTVSAIGLVAEIGDINRFATARQLMGYHAEPLERIRIVKDGIPARTVEAMAKCMAVPKERLVATLRLTRATVDRKARDNKPLSIDESARVLGLARLVGQVQEMVAESGDSAGFDSAAWVARWLQSPLPAFGGKRPAEFMDTADGQSLVSAMMARMQTGAYV